jgi:Tol biopolymer transport system component
MIALTRHRSGFNFDIYVMNPDGSAQRQVSTGPGWNADPAWAITVAK